eukprot:101819-Prymnesium_polylepis.1
MRVQPCRRAKNSQLTARRVRLPRVCSPAKKMQNNVARRIRAVGARLLYHDRVGPDRRVGDGRAALGVLGAPGARAACRRGCGGGGGAA